MTLALATSVPTGIRSLSGVLQSLAHGEIDRPTVPSRDCAKVSHGCRGLEWLRQEREGGFCYKLAEVFILLRYLLDRLFGASARADELRAVRSRLDGQQGPDVAGDAETRLALRLCQLREELMACLGPVQACAHCVRPRATTWPGGFCCSGRTEALFTDHELAALKLSGTTAGALTPPRAGQAGCVFRGPKGCSLKVAHRPCLCVRFVCGELQSELDKRNDRAAIARLQGELKLAFDRFVQQRNLRIEADSFAKLEASLRGPEGCR